MEGSTQDFWNATDPGTSITITCNDKYILLGDSAAMTCQDNGTWSEEVQCRVLGKFSVS